MTGHLPKWMNKEESVKDSSNKHEKRFAKRSGGKRRPASGALWFAKADVIIGKLALGDNKQTGAGSFRITKQIWAKIKQEAMEEAIPIPFLQIEMQDTPPLIVLEEEDFLALIQNQIEKG